MPEAILQAVQIALRTTNSWKLILSSLRPCLPDKSFTTSSQSAVSLVKSAIPCISLIELKINKFQTKFYSIISVAVNNKFWSLSAALNLVI